MARGASAMTGGTRRYWTAALACVLIAALALRLYSLDFGLPALNDPDELMFQMGAVRMLTGKTLNPGWFGHPATTTIYALAVLDVVVFCGGLLLGLWGGPQAFASLIYQDPTWVILPGRLVMVAFAVWGVWLVYRVGSKLCGRRVGIVAAAFVAFNPVMIFYSQIIRSDIMAISSMLMLILAALRIAEHGRWRDIVFAAFWLGVSIITKWPFAICGLAVAGALALRVREGRGPFAVEARHLIVFCVAAVIFGLGLSPFIVLDYPTLLRNLSGEAQVHHLGATGGPPLSNAWWYLSGPVFSGLGVLGAVFTVVGTICICRANKKARWIVFPTAAVFFVLICAQRLIWERWALPLFPIFAIGAGYGFVRLADLLRTRYTGRAQAIALVVLAAITIAPMLLVTMVNARVRLHDTRQIATRWVESHVAPGSSILVEHFGFDLLSGPYRFSFPLADAGCVDVRDMLAGTIQYSTIQAARDQRSNVDYGTLNPARRDTCRTHYAVLTQYDRYAAERGTFPEQYAAYRELLDRSTILETVRPVPGKVGGPIIRIIRIDR